MDVDALDRALAVGNVKTIGEWLTRHPTTPAGLRYKVELVRTSPGRPPKVRDTSSTKDTRAAAQVRLEMLDEAIDGRRPVLKRARLKAAKALCASERTVRRRQKNAEQLLASNGAGNGDSTRAESLCARAGERAPVAGAGINAEVPATLSEGDNMDDTSDIELQLEREAGAAEHVAGLLVGFGMAMALDPKATKENGGQEVYTERLFLRICIPGNKNYEWCQPATEADKLRWPESWRRYCNKAAATGTPLENLPGMSRSITKVLRKRGITSVETLAAVSDTNLGGLGLLGNTAREWRDTARRQLSGAQAAASAQANADEKAALEKQLKEMTERMAQMEAMLSATSPARRRNGAKPVLLPAEAIEDGEPAHV